MRLIPQIRDQLRENALLKKFYCDVNITDLIKYNEELAHRLVTEPAEMIPLVRTCPSQPSICVTDSLAAVRECPEKMHSPNRLPPQPLRRDP